MQSTFDVVIVGGGSAGISVAARLRRQRPALSVAVVDPASEHYYQPLFTLVGAGAVAKSATKRRQADVIPSGATWVAEAAGRFMPEENKLATAAGHELSYRYLVVCPGIQIDWQKIVGLEDALGQGGVCSNYSQETVDYTWECLRSFTGGRAIFTFPNTPIKCAGAPQKIMYLAEHHMRKQGIRSKSEVVFASAGKGIFAVKKYAAALNQIIQERQINTRFEHNLIAVDGDRRQATFFNAQSGQEVVIGYDLLHVSPPMSAPDFIKQSPLANEAGWVDVDKHSLRHVRYENVFSLGDASSLPTSKTGAAIRKQAPVVVDNLLAAIDQKPAQQSYDGYTSCPLVTGYGRLILAEFDYSGEPKETFPFDQSKERLSMYLLKKHGLPRLYWDGMLKGRL